MSGSYCRWLYAIQMAPALLSPVRLLKYIVENTYRETRQHVFLHRLIAYVINIMELA